MARMSPPESKVCFAISIEVDASNSFPRSGDRRLARIRRLGHDVQARGAGHAAGRALKWQGNSPNSPSRATLRVILPGELVVSPSSARDFSVRLRYRFALGLCKDLT